MPTKPIIPAVEGLRYDGLFLRGAAMFTDLQDGSPAWGNSFAVPPERCTEAEIRAERDRIREIYRRAAERDRRFGKPSRRIRAAQA